jgi:hypothetical protein
LAITVTPATTIVSNLTGTATSGSFTPAVGELLVVLTSGSATTSTAITTAVTDSNAGTWNTVKVANFTAPGGAGGQVCGIFTQLVAAATSMTVTTTDTGGTANACGLQVYRAAATGIPTIGASNTGAANGSSSITPGLTSTVNGSTLFASATEWSGLSATLSSTDLTFVFYTNNNEEGGFGYKTLGAPGAQTAHMSTTGASGEWYWATVEIFDGAGPGPAYRPDYRNLNNKVGPNALRGKAGRDKFVQQFLETPAPTAAAPPPFVAPASAARRHGAPQAGATRRARTGLPPVTAAGAPPFVAPQPLLRRNVPALRARARTNQPPVRCMPVLPNLYGLGLWFDASQITGLAPGASAASWTDLSPSGLTVTQGTGTAQPIYTPGGQNGLPTLRFRGGQYLTNATSYATGASWTVFSAASENLIANGWTIFNGVGNGFGLGVDGTLHSELVLRGQADILGSPATNNPEIHMGIRDGNTLVSNLYINGSVNATSSANYSLASGGITVGAFENGSGSLWNGDIFEIIGYTRTLSQYEIDLVTHYLAVKWGIAVSLVGATPVPSGTRFRRPATTRQARGSAAAAPVTQATVTPPNTVPVNPRLRRLAAAITRQTRNAPGPSDDQLQPYVPLDPTRSRRRWGWNAAGEKTHGRGAGPTPPQFNPTITVRPVTTRVRRLFRARPAVSAPTDLDPTSLPTPTGYQRRRQATPTRRATTPTPTPAQQTPVPAYPPSAPRTRRVATVLRRPQVGRPPLDQAAPAVQVKARPRPVGLRFRRPAGQVTPPQVNPAVIYQAVTTRARRLFRPATKIAEPTGAQQIIVPPTIPIQPRIRRFGFPTRRATLAPPTLTQAPIIPAIIPTGATTRARRIFRPRPGPVTPTPPQQGIITPATIPATPPRRRIGLLQRRGASGRPPMDQATPTVQQKTRARATGHRSRRPVGITVPPQVNPTLVVQAVTSRARRIFRPATRQVTPVPAQTNPVINIQPAQPRRRLALLRRRSTANPVSYQSPIIPPVIPSSLRLRPRTVFRPRTQQAEPTGAQQVIIPPTIPSVAGTRQRRIFRPRPGTPTPVPAQQTIIPPTIPTALARRRLASITRRAAVGRPPADQTTPLVQPKARARSAGHRFRRPTGLPVPAQVTVPPTVPIQPRVRRFLTLARRGTTPAPTPAQQAPIPATIPLFVRGRRVALLLRRRGVAPAAAPASPGPAGAGQGRRRWPPTLRRTRPAPVAPVQDQPATNPVRYPKQAFSKPRVNAGPPVPPAISPVPVRVAARLTRRYWQVLRRGVTRLPILGGLAPVQDVQVSIDEQRPTWRSVDGVNTWTVDDATPRWTFEEIN